MNSPIELRNYIEQLTAEHKKIKQFYYADYDDIIGSERANIEYPLLWMESPDVRPRNADHFNVEYSFSFLVLMAAPVDEKQMQLDNSIETFDIAMSILSRIQYDEEESNTLEFEIDDVDMHEVGAAAVGNNNETGWRVSMKLSTYVEHCYDPTDYEEVFDFEGVMTVGSLLGEGGITAYGFKNFGGEEFGSLDDFYTFYEYEGLYYVDGTLYVWGVDVDILSIDGIEYTDGTYNENGYTEFTIASNPFTGATAEIKIQGTATETWDYEGVMTVGVSGLNNGYFHISSFAYGSLTNFHGNFLYWNNGTMYGHKNYQYVKIDNLIINQFSWQIPAQTDILRQRAWRQNVSVNPFPAEGETCAIKIKL